MVNRLALLYVLTAALANLLAFWLGPAYTKYIAFFIIPIDMVLRDRLHEQWKSNLWPRMLVLILAGSVVSFLINYQAYNIALASFLAFLIGSLSDAVVFSLVKGDWRKRSILSNIPNAILDSVVFLYVAFGVTDPWLIGAQIVAKIAGGVLWTYLLDTRTDKFEFTNNVLDGFEDQIS